MALTNKQALQLLHIAEYTQQAIGLDELAFVALMRICRDYVDPSRYPAVCDRENGSWTGSINIESGSLRRFDSYGSNDRLGRYCQD